LLASNWRTRRPAYDFLIVGSGYGGAIIAARLATANLNPQTSVCVLERGSEWPSGTFPDSLDGVLAQTRSLVAPLGLYEILHFRDISVISGSGVGGSSLISAGVAALPEAAIFQQHWPAALNYEALLPYYRRALEVLDARPHPRAHEIKKVQALERRAREVGDRATPLMLAINFNIDGANRHGVDQKPCIDCGDCITGCNVGSMNSLDKNYLALARRAGAEIFTAAEVQWLEKRSEGRWRVHGFHLTPEREAFTIDAANVVLAAGAIHSAEILLRSAHHGLSVSRALGTRFSGNGDLFGLAYNGDFSTRIEGFGNHPDSPLAADPPGPTIVAGVHTAGQHPALIEGISLPRAYVNAARIAFTVIRGESTRAGSESHRRTRMASDFLFGDPASSGGALDRSLFYLAFGLHDGEGQLSFEVSRLNPEGALKIDWANANEQLLASILQERLRRHARSMGAHYVSNPLWGMTNVRHTLTPHPIGGCPIGDNPDSGAVDPYGRVFAADGSVHDGLFVSDGSLLPAPLGVNPMLTICALAEHIANGMLRNAKGEHYPERRVLPTFGRLDPVQVSSYREAELERLFDSTAGGPAEWIVTGGQKGFDVRQRLISNAQLWRGFLPVDHTISAVSAPLFGGFQKTVTRRGSRLISTTEDGRGRLRVRSQLKEVEIKKGTGDLKAGRYILGSYLDPPWEGLYEVLRILTSDIVLGRVYSGKYPHGARLFAFTLCRLYEFDRMTIADHRDLFDSGIPVNPSELAGVWRMDAIGCASSAGSIGYLRLQPKPDGRLESALESAGLMEHLILPSFVADTFNVVDLGPEGDGIRQLTDDLLIGRHDFAAPPEFSLWPATLVGLLRHERKGANGGYSFQYLLSRVGELP
jgi:cholesterol oxidase